MDAREGLARVLAEQDSMVGGPEGEFSVMAWQMQMAKIAAAYARADAILASPWLAQVREEAERAGMLRERERCAFMALQKCHELEAQGLLQMAGVAHAVAAAIRAEAGGEDDR